MRAAPPLTFTVRRFGAWRAALVSLAVAGCVVIALWWHAWPPPRAGWVSSVAAAGLLFAVLPLAEAWRQRALVLNWDGMRWHVGGERVAGEPRVGAMVVALDLGNWLLLRFVAESPADATWLSNRSSAAWIALQRRGLEAEWHAIRCTVHAPPAAAPAGVPARLPE